MKKEKAAFEQFNSTTSIEKLDFILNYLNNDALPESIEEIERKLEWDLNSLQDSSITSFYIDKVVNVIINQLIKDEFVIEKHRAEIKLIEKYEPAGMTYYISLKGKIFIENGGYHQKQINDKIELDEIKERNKRMERNDERLVLWTKILAFGTIGLLLFELLKLICEHYNK